MQITPLGDTRYEVEGENEATYLVDIERGRCTCPDHTYRGERCKHLRRVAIEITEGQVPPPDHIAVECEVCEADLFVERDATEPHLCENHEFEPGAFAYDRNTGDRVLVVDVADLRADEVTIDSRGGTVADHYSNADYDSDAPVIAAVYPQSVQITEHGAMPDSLTVYSFPRPRLSRTPVERGTRQQRLSAV